MGIKWYSILGFLAAVLLLAVLLLPRDREYGVQLNRSHRPGAARKFLLPALAKNPDDRTIVFEAARMHSRSGDNLRAGQTLEKYLARHRDETAAQEQALAYYLQGHHLAQAASLLERYGFGGPGSFDRLVSLYEQQGRLDKAVAALEAETRAHPLAAGKWLRLSTLYAWSNRPLAAARARERAARAEPEKFGSSTWLELLRTYLWLGRPRLAARAADELQVRGNLSPEAAREVRELRIRMRDLPGALRAARLSIRGKHATRQDWLDCVQLEAWAGHEANALATLQQAMKRFPRNLEMLRQAVHYATRLKQPELAADFQQQAARISRMESDWRDAAEMLLLAGNPQQALTVLARFQSAPDPQPRTRIMLIEIALLTKNMDLARSQADLLYAQPPHSENLNLQLADLLGRVGRGQKQFMILERLFMHNPNLLDAGLQLADAYSARKQYWRAEKILATLARKFRDNPGAARVMSSLAQARLDIFWSTQDEESRLRLARPAIRSIEVALQYRDDPQMRVSLAWLLTLTGQPGKAEKALVDPRLLPADLLLAMVEAYRKKSRPQQAMRLLRRYLAVKAGDTDALYTLGDLKAELGLDPRPEFLQYLALAPEPRDAEDWTRRARILWLRGKRRFALNAMRRAAASAPGSHAIALDLADMLVRAGLDGEACMILEKMPRPASVRARAEKLYATALARLGRYGPARRVLRKLIKDEPKNAEAVADLAFVEDALLNHPTAMRLYGRALDLGRSGR